MIQIRNVPDDTHQELKVRATLAGMTLSDYLLAELHQVLERPTVDELRQRLSRRSEAELSEPPARAVRAVRDAP